MQNLTCILCPSGCSLSIEENDNLQDGIHITGNKCPRGIAYATEEIRDPKRTVTATCSVSESDNSLFSVRRVPVKTVQPCPKEKISALLDEIYKVKISLPVKQGDLVIKNWNGLGIDVAVTRTISDQIEM